MDRPSLILLVGIPGSGKTAYAHKYVAEHPNTIHIASDNIRKELWGNESIQGDPKEVFSLMKSRAIEALNNGKNVVYDATHMTRKDRADIISACPRFVKIECHIIWAPIETCIQRDAARERTVGKAVIDRMLRRFQSPYYDEDIDEIQIIRPDDWDRAKGLEYRETIWATTDIPHDNPHHTLDIQQHCTEAFKYVLTHYENDDELQVAACWHDVGKPYVKAFIDSKGNPCEHAHYYQHQCVGSWMLYGINGITPLMAWLVSVHMDPFMNTKYYNKLPMHLKEKVDKLHEADLAAH